MKRMLTVLVAVMVGLSGVAWAQDDGDEAGGPPPAAEGHGGHKGGGPGGGHGGRHGGKGPWRNLSPACKEKLEALRAETRAKRAEIEKTVKDPAERQTKIQALMQETKAKRQAILAECKAAAPAPAASGAPAPAPSPAPSAN